MKKISKNHVLRSEVASSIKHLIGTAWMHLENGTGDTKETILGCLRGYAAVLVPYDAKYASETLDRVILISRYSANIKNLFGTCERAELCKVECPSCDNFMCNGLNVSIWGINSAEDIKPCSCYKQNA